MVGPVAAFVVVAAFAAAAPPAATGPPRGTFGTHITGTGVPLLDATWQLQIGKGGRYVLTRDGSVAARGQAHMAGKAIVFTDTAGRYACRGAVKSGSYGWSLAKRGGTQYLLLQVRRDGCAGRRTVLSQPLARF